MSYQEDRLKEIADAIRSKTGKTDPIKATEFASEIASIEAGGGSEDIGNGKYIVKVIDYDGSIIDEKHLNIGDVYTLPNAPTHNRLIFQEWVSPIDIVDNTVTVEDFDIIIGAVYTTTSGLSEFDISLAKVTGLTVTLNMDGTKDWGDGTSDALTTHTYADYGDYMITCDGTVMTTSSSSGLFGQSSTNYNYYCVNSRFGGNITAIGAYPFQYCCSLKSVIIHKDVDSIGDYCFYYCYALQTIIFPNKVTNIRRAMCYYNYSLEYAIFTNKAITLWQEAFRGCSKLRNISIDGNFNTIDRYTFNGCYSLEKIYIPQSISSINNAPFNGCYNLIEYNFCKHTLVPSLSSSSDLGGINALCKIVVPDNLYDEWIVATNWSDMANYIYKASEVAE